MRKWMHGAAGLTLAATLSLCCGCAAPGSPQPPSLNLPRPVEDLRAERIGDKVALSWTEPTQTTDHQNIRQPGETRLCVAVRQYPMARCVETIRVLRASDLPPLDHNQQRERIQVLAPLPAVDGSGFATYVVEAFNNHGRSAGFSNQTRVWMGPSLARPQGLTATVEADGARLRWTPAAAPLGLRSFMRVLRRGEGDKQFATIAELPYAGAEDYLDASAQWEKSYEYKLVARVQQPGLAGAEAGSEESATVSIMLHDSFPPARPVGLEAVHAAIADKKFIDLSWTPNEERDLAGYIVWRRAAGQAAPQRMNDKPLVLPSWRDESAAVGVEYRYRTQAVDRHGNLSPLSEEAVETIPAE